MGLFYIYFFYLSVSYLVEIAGIDSVLARIVLQMIMTLL